jgi:hypothetical protein
VALAGEESVSGVTGGSGRGVNQENPPMRIYIIGNDGITLCRETPTAVNEDEIAVASNAELHAARISGKQLLALWNALPGVEKRRKVGDREALIDQLWSAIELLPDPEPQSNLLRFLYSIKENWLPACEELQQIRHSRPNPRVPSRQKPAGFGHSTWGKRGFSGK